MEMAAIANAYQKSLRQGLKPEGEQMIRGLNETIRARLFVTREYSRLLYDFAEVKKLNHAMGFSFTVSGARVTTLGLALDTDNRAIPFDVGNQGATAVAQDNCVALRTISSAYLFSEIIVVSPAGSA